MELKDLLVTGVNNLMLAERVSGDTYILLVNDYTILLLRELDVARPEATHYEVRQHLLFHELSIDCKELALKCNLILNSKAHVLETFSFIH
jgi:hypothetical protein